MRKEQVARSATMLGASDLTIIAPLKKGLVPALDAVTYKTRAMRVLKTLHAGRALSHEYDIGRVLSDAVERVGRIHSIRIALIEPEDKIMLAVTFDGSWESYIRVIWQKVSRCLDLIFCNTEGYVRGWSNSFDDWCTWLREHQAETPFLYSTPRLTYLDAQYLRAQEYRLRAGESAADAELAVTRFRLPAAEDISDSLKEHGNDPSKIGDDTDRNPVLAARPAFRQGMRSLAGLYRLAEVYLPGTADGEVLHLATRELLREFEQMVTGDGSNDVKEELAFANRRFRDALDWFRFTPVAPRDVPALSDTLPAYPRDEVQGGIVVPYEDVSDGCLVMLAFDSPQAFAKWLAAIGARLTSDAAQAGLAAGGQAPRAADAMTVNVALTMEGLRLAGLSEAEIAQLPQEFIHGMDKRAGMLGDVRMNHPRRWRLPALNAHLGADAPEVAAHDPVARVELSSVHAVLQLRLLHAQVARPAARQLLWKQACDLTPDARRLSVQWMLRLKEGGAVREHFGYLDGGSDPVIDPDQQGTLYPNRVQLGEILLGHANAADAATPPERRGEMEKLLANGSFLVVRKLRQDVPAFQALVARAAERVKAIGGIDGDPADLVKAKLVGRWPLSASGKAGQPLTDVFGEKGPNDFTYQDDPDGAKCPFHAHMRRANPRDLEGSAAFAPPGARPARLVRRSMSYGELPDPADPATGHAERGLVFMAYNASIGEQFEVVQRWLTGGNSTGGYSGQSDALMGLPEQGRPRVVRFEAGGQAVRVELDGSTAADEETQPLVRLEWGMYLFVPSLPAVQELAARAGAAKGLLKAWSVERGETEIARLRHVERTQSRDDAIQAWKEALEDPAAASEFRSASIWAAIRERHGGVLRTAYGVLAASRTAVAQVVRDREHLSVKGYLPRMAASFGELYLGLDDDGQGGRYQQESVEVNAAIEKLVSALPFDRKVVDDAERAVSARIQALATEAKEYARDKQGEQRWELTLDARELTDDLLATFGEAWFGLRPGKHLQRSGMRWNWQEEDKACYPGHFMAPSRYTFQPHPGSDVVRVGSAHGKSLHKALTEYLASQDADVLEAIESSPVARTIVQQAKKLGDSDYAVRTLAGVLMGFFPTTDGNMRRVLDEWLNTGTLWRLRARRAAIRQEQQAGVTAASKAALRELDSQVRTEFMKAMQLRAAPETLWRTTVKPFTLGAAPHRVTVQPDEIVVASLISATQECLEKDVGEVSDAFGGRRDGSATCPVHACPGYGPALSVMLGFFRALVDAEEGLRPGPGPLSLTLEGDTGLKEQPQDFVEVQRGVRFKSVTYGFTPKQRVPFLGIGDSWAYRTTLSSTLTGALQRAGYDAAYAGRYCSPGKTIASLAEKTTLAGLVQFIVGHAEKPSFVFLSGGGNDIVQHPGDDDYDKTRLFSLLVAGQTDPAKALRTEEARAYVEKVLGRDLKTVLQGIRARTKLPILVHGYDFPIPDNRPAFIEVLGVRKQLGPWLCPAFEAARIGPDVGRQVMKTLIGMLNEMVAAVAGTVPAVTYVPLAGTLEKQQGFGDGDKGYYRYWDNELHATDEGFDVLAKKVVAAAPVKPRVE